MKILSLVLTVVWLIAAIFSFVVGKYVECLLEVYIATHEFSDYLGYREKEAK